jgi:two-component system, OmpR family, phosphate regulon response regulator PhoB
MSSKANVLVVEDERDVRDLMSLHLKREGHDVTAVEDGEEALKIIHARHFDLVVLDWMLPGVSGLEICKRLRNAGQSGATSSQIPVLMVTARADTADIVLGLEMGADDYITKPFDIPVLVARVRALLRRVQTTEDGSNDKKTKAGNLSIDSEAHRAFCGAEEIQLTASEFKLLHALMINAGRVLSRERLIDLVQGQGVVVVDRAIDTHVFGLRKKLGECAEIVETIRGVGYRIKSM